MTQEKTENKSQSTLPLFQCLEKHSLEKSLFAVSARDLKEDLTYLQVPESLVDELYEVAIQVAPLAFMTYCRPPETLTLENRNSLIVEDERASLEGRGYYHNTHLGYMYEKGLGAGGDVQTESSKGNDYPGFPFTATHPSKFFHDPLTHDEATPRIRGTDTRIEALNEYIEGVILFSEYVKENNIRTLDEVRDHGLVVPLIVGILPELSARLNEKRSELLRHDHFEKNPIERKSAEWEGNDQQSTILFMVPSNSRVPRIQPHSRYQYGGKVMTQEAWEGTGTSLRNALKHNRIFEIGSMHGKNAYLTELKGLSLPDFADLIDLAEITDEKISLCFGERVSKLSVAEYLITCLLTAQEGLTPFIGTFPQEKYTSEVMFESQKTFFKCLFSETAVNEQGLERAILLFPFFHGEISLAMARILAASYPVPEGRLRRHQRRKLVHKYSEYAPLLKEYAQHDVKHASVIALQNWKEVRNHPDIMAFVHLIETGDASYLKNCSSDLQKKFELLDAIFALPQGEDREKLLYKLTKVLVKNRDVQTSLECSPVHDLIYDTDSQLFVIAKNLIERQRYEEASRVLGVLGQLNEKGFSSKDLMHPADSVEPLEYLFVIGIMNVWENPELLSGELLKAEALLELNDLLVGIEKSPTKVNLQNGFEIPPGVGSPLQFLWQMIGDEALRNSAVALQNIHSLKNVVNRYIEKRDISLEEFANTILLTTPKGLIPEEFLLAYLYTMIFIEDNGTDRNSRYRRELRERINSYFRNEYAKRAAALEQKKNAAFAGGNNDLGEDRRSREDFYMRSKYSYFPRIVEKYTRDTGN